MGTFVGLILDLFVTALSLFMLARYASSHHKKEVKPNTSVNSTDKKQQNRNNWTLPIIIAIIIAIKTVIGGIFFFVIVWLMLLNPKPYSKTWPAPSNIDKKIAKRIYTWLLLSSCITVPIFAILVLNLSRRPSINERVLSALIPVLVHMVLLLGFNSKSPFVYRHTQQAIFLVALRAGMAALAVNIGSDPEDGLGLFIIGNGSLWLFSTLWGRNQIFHGKCWWMERKGETIVAKVRGNSESEMADLASESKRTQNLSPKEHIYLSDKSLISQQKSQAKEHALAAFRLGNEKIRKQAVDILNELGEVEMF